MGKTSVRTPWSHATNAYDLVSDVIRVIEEEPKRFDMADWLDHIMPSRVKKTKSLQERYPACGTVACVAGWIVTLRHGIKKAVHLDISREARDILTEFENRDVLDEEAYQRVYNMGHELERLFYAMPPSYGYTIGTVAYAQYMGNALRAFQQKYEPELRARTFTQEKSK